MNKVILMGRLTRDPEIRYSQGAEPMPIARYTLAVARRGAKESEEQECAESKSHSQQSGYVQEGAQDLYPANGDGFINMPDGIDEELPFN